MTALDEAIREAVRNGLRGLTLWHAGDGRFQGNATYDGVGWHVEFDADPAVALQKALGAPEDQRTEQATGSIFD